MLAGGMECVGPTLKMTPSAEVGIIERLGPPLLPAMPPPNDEDGNGAKDNVGPTLPLTLNVEPTPSSVVGPTLPSKALGGGMEGRRHRRGS